jgi:predicted Fe-Mo cluster-binding NifX family protein
MVKLAVSTEGPGLDEAVDPRFGRAAGFMIVDPTDMSFEYIDNGVSQAMGQGAGIQAAESVARSGAKVLLTGYVGPKAFHALTAAGIEVGQNLDNMTVGEAVQAYLDGRVEAAGQANRGSHGR